MRYTIQQINSIVRGRLVGDLTLSQNAIDHIYFDTRKIGLVQDSLFIAIESSKRDGHAFISDAHSKGIRACMVHKNDFIKRVDELIYILVDDTIRALQDLALYHRQHSKIISIGITGSNGKTTVKEWLSPIMFGREVFISPLSYNSQIGVALSVLEIEDYHKIGIFEAGISTAGEMDILAEMIDCNIGIFTNLGDAHQTGFENRLHKLGEKLRLFENAESIIAQDNYQDLIAEHHPELLNRCIFWGDKESSRFWFSKEDYGRGTLLLLTDSANAKDYTFQTHFTHRESIENVMNVIICALFLKIDPERIQEGIRKLTPKQSRLELKEGARRVTIIDDSYSFDIISFNAALSFMQQHADKRERVLIMSDIDQIEVDYQQLANLINQYQIQKVFTIGQDIFNIHPLLESSVERYHFNSTDEALDSIRKHPITNAIVLIKGARRFGLESIARYLTKKFHQAEVQVNLSALQHNLNVISKHLHSTTKILSVIKANSYGTGSVKVAKFLQNAGIDYLGVAFLDEAILLRENGINTPILVLNPEYDNFDLMEEYDLDCEIYDISQLEKIVNQSFVGRLKLHLKLDTGMNRLGFTEDNLNELIDFITAHGIHIDAIMSHFSASDQAHSDLWNNRQIESFERMVHNIETSIGYKPMKHMLNSTGVIRFPENQYDMVRTGKAMYGIDPTGILSRELQKVHRVIARVSQIKKVKQGGIVGYGAHNPQAQAITIAILGIGYADGIVRNLGNGNASFYYRGHLVSTVGYICMDMCMVDISAVPDARVGDEVEIFGPHVDIHELALGAHTIALELLSGLSDRLTRIYTEQ